MQTLTTQRALLIGGVGGSGTRVVAKIVRELGFYIGSNLNVSLDNLDWPGDRSLVLDKSKTDQEKLVEIRKDLSAFAKKMVLQADELGYQETFWASKVPGSFFFLPFLNQTFSNLHYIHLVRNGLDMAFSKNKNQLNRWGSFFDVYPDKEHPHKSQLKYWARANEYALDLCSTLLGERHIVLRFEDICLEKEKSVKKILEFLNKKDSAESINKLIKLIEPPDSLGRYKELIQPGMFDKQDIQVVKELGYNLEC
jgi:hypothetical protein